MAVLTIECENAFLSEQNFESITAQLSKRSANWHPSLIRSELLRSRKTQIAYLLLIDPAVEFDDTKTSSAEIELLLRQFGLKGHQRRSVRVETITQ